MEPLPVIMLGAGGHARVLMDTLILLRVRVLGFVTPDPRERALLGVPLLGDDSILDGWPPQSVRLVNGIGSTALPVKRREIYQRLKARGYDFQSVIHPSAVVARDVELGEGVQIMAGAVIQTGSRIDPNSIVNTRAGVDHDCRVAAHVHIAPGATLCGAVSIEENVHVGSGSTVVQGICVGSNSLIGAGSLVIRNVPQGAAVIGVPAREMKR